MPDFVSRSLARMVRVLVTVAASTALVGLALADGGCGNDTEASPPSCALPADGDDDLCSALATYYGRCGQCEDCRGKNLQNCKKRGAALSGAHRAALIACKD